MVAAPHLLPGEVTLWTSSDLDLSLHVSRGPDCLAVLGVLGKLLTGGRKVVFLTTLAAVM